MCQAPRAPVDGTRIPAKPPETAANPGRAEFDHLLNGHCDSLAAAAAAAKSLGPRAPRGAT
eukprot:13970304-Alexandrium_andersonii.AAC.1